MSVERHVMPVDGMTANAPHQRRKAPGVDSMTWTGQLESVESPYTAKQDRKVETGFRGRRIEVVRDAKSTD